MPPSELLIDQVRTLLIGEPGLSEREMFGGLCFMINGKDDLMLSEGPDALEAALQLLGICFFTSPALRLPNWG